MKKLSAFINALELPYRLIGEDAEVEHITYDSREVRKGSMFVAIKGFHSDGNDFIPVAIQQGAAVIVSETKNNIPVTQVVVPDTRRALAELSYEFYGSAYNNFELTGITGTNGKTTLTHLLYQIAESAGKNPALIGTLGIRTHEGLVAGDRTTPESSDLAKTFDDLHKKNIGSVFMEVSSHAIVLDRVHTLRFDAAVFTNLTQDHLDFHLSMETYFEAKAKLFDHMKPGARGIINIDDPYGRRLYNDLEIGKYSYAVENPDADYHYSDLLIDVNGIHGVLSTPGGPVHVSAPLLGKFNAENIAGAIAVWQTLYPEIAIDLNEFPFKAVEGRMEMVKTTKSTAVIDYAHTPDAMEKALKAASELENRHRIITVFGCGGDRDKAKRPIMGRIAESYSDKIILTNDNPRSEEPGIIINEILEGISDKKKTEVCIDRKRAIEMAWNKSRPGDLLMILGKGAETYMEIRGERIPFNDKDIVIKLEQKK